MSARSKAELEIQLATALGRLASARRESLSKEDYAVFADGLREFPLEDVMRVCDDLGRIAPEEYQPRFPPLHVIRAECFRVMQHRSERKMLTHAELSELYPPLPPERVTEILRRFREVLSEKAMR